MTPIINRNVSIPVKQSEYFSTSEDSQDTVEIHILQGERPLAKDNKSLGIFKLTNIPAIARGVPKIKVTFQLDVNGILSVSAKEEISGQEQSITIEGSSILDKTEIEKMLKIALENTKIDNTKKVLINSIYESDNLFNNYDLLFNNNKNININLKNRILFDLTIIKDRFKNHINNLINIINNLKQLKNFYQLIILNSFVNF